MKRRGGISEATLAELLASYASGDVDKAGFSRLDLWLSEQIHAGAINDEGMTKIVTDLVALPSMKTPGHWAALYHVVAKLELRSENLATSIETAIGRADLSSVDPFDAFCAWLCLHESGGLFSPRMLEDTAFFLRSKEPVKWLHLAIIAYAGIPTNLIKSVGDLIAEGLLRPQDIETRIRAIQSALGEMPIAEFLARILEFSPNKDFTDHLVAWAQRRLGIAIARRSSKQTPRLQSEPQEQLQKFLNSSIPTHEFASALV